MPSIRPLDHRLLRAARVAIVLTLLMLTVGALGFSYAYRRYSRVVDRRLAHSPLFIGRPRLRNVANTMRPGPVPAPSISRRGTRRVPAYDALPPRLVQAVVAIEDRRFFQHSGVNYLRTAECAVQDTFTLHAVCGGSTITQQLARTDFLTADKTFRRKVAEIVIARRLESRLNKQQIFAMYAREVNLGQHGPVPIKGFRQASVEYFGKDLNQLDLAQCALLAGMVHAPNFDNPYRHPDRAAHRRNVVLNAMVEIGAISRAEAEAAKAEPLNLAGMTAPDPLGDPDMSIQG